MELATGVDGLVLRTLDVSDLDRYARLVHHNRLHLTTNGDFHELVEATEQELAEELGNAQPGRFGIWRRSGFSFMHGESMHPDVADAPFHVTKVIKDPSE